LREAEMLPITKLDIKDHEDARMMGDLGYGDTGVEPPKRLGAICVIDKLIAKVDELVERVNELDALHID